MMFPYWMKKNPFDRLCQFQEDAVNRFNVGLGQLEFCSKLNGLINGVVPAI